jgi:hypothetical protein
MSVSPSISFSVALTEIECYFQFISTCTGIFVSLSVLIPFCTWIREHVLHMLADVGSYWLTQNSTATNLPPSRNNPGADADYYHT